MKKNNQKGFMLVEAFVVSAFVLGVLVFMFIQLKTVVNGFDRSFTYKTISGIYTANELGDFITQYDYENIKLLVDQNGYANVGSKYYDNYDVDKTNIGNPIGMLWSEMLLNANVKTIIVAHENIEMLKENYINVNLHFPEWETDVTIQKPSSKFTNYINSLKIDNLVGRYRVIVEYNDETFASVKLP